MAFECLASLASEDDNGAVLLFLEQILAAVVNDELGGFHVGLKIEFLGNKSQWHVRLVSVVKLALDLHHDRRRMSLRLANVAQGSKTLPADKHIHEVCTHVWGLVVQLEEPMVVPQGQGGPHVQGVLDRLVFLFCWG